MKFITLIILGLSFCSFGQHGKLEKTFFPEEEYDINTPAFNGRKFTNYKSLLTFLNNLQAENPNLFSVSFIGTSGAGDSIPMITVKSLTKNKKVRIWMQGGLHGNEPASTEGTLFILEKIAKGEFDDIINDFELAIIPMANIDGYQKLYRFNKKDLDLNRDQTAFVAHESPYLKKAFLEFNPDVAVDFHEYNPYRSDYVTMGKHGITTAYDALFLNTGNLNIDPSIRLLNDSMFVPSAAQALHDKNRKTNTYFSPQSHQGVQFFNYGSNSERSSSTNFGLSNCVSILCEIRGVNLLRQSFKRRVNTTAIIATSYIRTAVKNKAKLWEVIQVANDNEMKRSQPISIRSKREYESIGMTFIDIEDQNYVEIPITILNAFKQKPTLSRERPVAYVLMPSETHAVENLEILGVKVEKTSAEMTLSVQEYLVNVKSVSPVVFQKMHTTIIKTELKDKEITFPKGSFIVYMSQENANYIAVTMEPESPNSFCHFNVVSSVLDQTLPYYRLLTEIK